jgi:hypothetical protein
MSSIETDAGLRLGDRLRSLLGFLGLRLLAVGGRRLDVGAGREKRRRREEDHREHGRPRDTFPDR